MSSKNRVFKLKVVTSSRFTAEIPFLQTDDFVNFMKDPKEGPPPPPPEKEWSDQPSKIHHLSDNDFDSFMKDHNSVLVMFYAPCKLTLLDHRFLIVRCLDNFFA